MDKLSINKCQWAGRLHELRRVINVQIGPARPIPAARDDKARLVASPTVLGQAGAPNRKETVGLLAPCQASPKRRAQRIHYHHVTSDLKTSQMRGNLALHLKRRPVRVQLAVAHDHPAVMAGIVPVQNESRAGEGIGHVLQQLLAEVQQVDHRPVLDAQSDQDHWRVRLRPSADNPADFLVNRVRLDALAQAGPQRRRNVLARDPDEANADFV